MTCHLSDRQGWWQTRSSRPRDANFPAVWIVYFLASGIFRSVASNPPTNFHCSSEYAGLLMRDSVGLAFLRWTNPTPHI